MPHKILIIDRNRSLHQQIISSLGELDYLIASAFCGSEALDHLEKQVFDLVIMDLSLPDMGGFYLLEQLHALSSTSIIVLSSKHEEAYCIRALEEGADDFVMKPIVSMAEFLMRIQAILRRRKPRRLSVAQIEIDLIEKRVWHKGQELKLGDRQFRFLAALAARPNQVRGYEELLSEVYDEASNEKVEFLYVLAHSLRRLLEENPKRPTLIQGIRGVGYFLNNPLES